MMLSVVLGCPAMEIEAQLGQPLWLEELLLLALAFIGLLMWRRQRPSVFLFAAAVYATVLAALFFLLQLSRPLDARAVEVVFGFCAGATLIVYGSMMRAELTRVVTSVFPRARVHRHQRRGS